MQQSAAEDSSQWSWCPDVIFRQFDNNTARDYVIAGAIVCEKEHSQADGKEKCQREVFDC